MLESKVGQTEKLMSIFRLTVCGIAAVQTLIFYGNITHLFVLNVLNISFWHRTITGDRGVIVPPNVNHFTLPCTWRIEASNIIQINIMSSHGYFGYVFLKIKGMLLTLILITRSFFIFSTHAFTPLTF